MIRTVLVGGTGKKINKCRKSHLGVVLAGRLKPVPTLAIYPVMKW